MHEGYLLCRNFSGVLVFHDRSYEVKHYEETVENMAIVIVILLMGSAVYDKILK